MSQQITLLTEDCSYVEHVLHIKASKVLPLANADYYPHKMKHGTCIKWQGESVARGNLMPANGNYRILFTYWKQPNVLQLKRVPA